MLDDNDLERLAIAARAATWPLTLSLHAEPGHALSEPLRQLAAQVAAACGTRVLLREAGPDPAVERPALILTADGLRVCYQAAIAGPERPPFVELLVAALGRRQAVASTERRPVELQVFVAATCHHCPRVVRAALELALQDSRLRVAVIDAQHFAALARRHGIRSVPACVVDDGLVLVGELEAAELRRVLDGLETPGHRTALLRSLVEAGRFDDALQRLGESDGLVHFVALWAQSTTGLRIGLLLMAEKVLARDVSALDPCVGGLLPLLRSADAALRGDSADLLGRIGSDTALAALRPLRDDPDPDVADIVAEALEHNSRRNQPS